MNRCSVCAHPERAAIDAALIAGESERGIVGRFGVSKGAVGRHRPHAKKKLERASAAEGRSLVRLLEDLHADALEVFEMGREDADGELMIKALRERRELAALEFGTKATVKTTTEARQEFAALPPAEKRERIAEARHRLLELEAETAGGDH